MFLALITDPGYSQPESVHHKFTHIQTNACQVLIPCRWSKMMISWRWDNVMIGCIAGICLYVSEFVMYRFRLGISWIGNQGKEHYSVLWFKTCTCWKMEEENGTLKRKLFVGTWQTGVSCLLVMWGFLKSVCIHWLCRNHISALFHVKSCMHVGALKTLAKQLDLW